MRDPVGFALVSLVLFGLTACSPGAPAGGPQPVAATPTPTESAGRGDLEPPVADVITISGSAIEIATIDRTVIVEVPFATDGPAAVDLLAAALGVDPTVTVLPANVCRPETTVHTWGGLDLQVPGYTTAAPGASFTVHATGPVTAEGVEIQSVGATQVGSTIADVLAIPGIHTTDDGFGGITAQLDRTSTHGPDHVDAHGAMGYLERGTNITSIISPVYFYGDC